MKYTSLDDLVELELLTNGYQQFDGDIDSVTTPEALGRLRYILLPDKPRNFTDQFTVYLNSPGGYAYDSLKLYDGYRFECQQHNLNFTIVVEGWAASAASMIFLQAADHRLAQPHARFLLHELRRWGDFGEETTSQIQDEAKELEALTQIVVKILADRCGQSRRTVRNLLNRKETFMNAEQALKWGLIDGILGRDNDVSKE